ncbi:MAG: peptidoglycan editing factor PgeF [Patescibacteria group bacterium]|nr:peptidoglycan editing factor PgeF [Patescibacteria group bacterium]
MEEHFFKFSIFSAFSELSHGISNRHFGDMRFGHQKEEITVKNREQFLHQLNINISDLVVPALAHGAQIAVVDQNDRGKGATNLKTAIMATDGLITKDSNVYLMVTIADCLPVLIYDPTLKIAGVLHAGWRGIIAQIVPKAIEKFKSLGSEPRNLVVGVGPGICQKHFVVKKDVLSFFLDYYPSAAFVRNNDGYVDLKKAVFVDLKNTGVASTNIEISNVCTACENGIYGSYRKEKEGVPAAAAVIGIKQ